MKHLTLLLTTASSRLHAFSGTESDNRDLGTGALKIRFSDGEKIAALSGGFIKSDREKTLILATTCEWKDEIDLERAKHAEEKAREMLQHAQSNAEHDLAELKLKRAVNRINIAE